MTYKCGHFSTVPYGTIKTFFNMNYLKSQTLDQNLTNQQLFNEHFNIKKIGDFKAHLFFEIGKLDLQDEPKEQLKKAASFLCDSCINFQKITRKDAQNMQEIAIFLTFESYIYNYSEIDNIKGNNADNLLYIYQFARILEKRMMANTIETNMEVSKDIDIDIVRLTSKGVNINKDITIHRNIINCFDVNYKEYFQDLKSRTYFLVGELDWDDNTKNAMLKSIDFLIERISNFETITKIDASLCEEIAISFLGWCPKETDFYSLFEIFRLMNRTPKHPIS